MDLEDIQIESIREYQVGVLVLGSLSDADRQIAESGGQFPAVTIHRSPRQASHPYYLLAI